MSVQCAHQKLVFSEDNEHSKSINNHVVEHGLCRSPVLRARGGNLGDLLGVIF